MKAKIKRHISTCPFPIPLTSCRFCNRVRASAQQLTTFRSNSTLQRPEVATSITVRFQNIRYISGLPAAPPVTLHRARATSGVSCELYRLLRLLCRSRWAFFSPSSESQSVLSFRVHPFHSNIVGDGSCVRVFGVQPGNVDPLLNFDNVKHFPQLTTVRATYWWRQWLLAEMLHC